MNEPPKRAIVLFAHGARNARWSDTLLELRQRLLARVPAAVVEVAFLEFQAPTLATALSQVVASGCLDVDVVPVFWASGGHVDGDVMPLIDELRARQPQLRLRLLPVLSDLPGLLDFVADTIARFERS